MLVQARRATRQAARIAAVAVLLLLMPSVQGVAAPPPAQQADRVAVGDTAIDFTMQSLDGETYRLSDLRGEKKAIIIFFRGSW